MNATSYQFDKHKGTYITEVANDRDTYGSGAGGFTAASINSTNYEHPNFRGAAVSVEPPRYLRSGLKGSDTVQKLYHPEDINRDETGKEVSRQHALFYVKPPVITNSASTHNYLPETKMATATAIAESKKRYGRVPWASNNTSAYSTPAVNKAVEAGVLGGIEHTVPGQQAEQGNISDMAWGKEVAQTSAHNVKIGMSKGATFKQRKLRSGEVKRNVSSALEEPLKEHARKKRGLPPADQKKEKAPKKKTTTKKKAGIRTYKGY